MNLYYNEEHELNKVVLSVSKQVRLNHLTKETVLHQSKIITN